MTWIDQANNRISAVQIEAFSIVHSVQTLNRKINSQWTLIFNPKHLSSRLSQGLVKQRKKPRPRSSHWNNLITTFSKSWTISGLLTNGYNWIFDLFELVHVKQTIRIARTFLCSCKCYRTKVNAVYLLAVHNIKENHDVFTYFIFSFVLDKTHWKCS